MKIVLASGNAGKIREFNQLLNALNIEVVPQSAFGIKEIAETGLSFVENAILKARYACEVSGMPALADDSGLAVAALSGAPGIYSARYAGDHVQPNEHINKLLAELAKTGNNDRSAEFHCALAFMSHANDPIPLICEGRWQGNILPAPRGDHGFGYDPVFYVPSQQKSAAELPSEIKNKLSHRALAIQSLLTLLPEKLHECTVR